MGGAAAAPAAAYASGHYHFSVEGVGRGSGAPVMAKAAYRSGECLFDEQTGQFHDYTGGAERVIETFVMARENAPAWMQHAAREARQRAWNEAERAEPRVNGRLATELVVGLPHELTDAQRRQLLSAFVLRIVEKHGVFADVSVHTAHDERNIHAHILLSHRELGPDGFGEIANTRYENRKRKGEIVREKVAGIAATPSAIKGLREQWAQDVNRAYERAGLDIRVDHRSFEDRGIRDVPTIHLGPKAAAMERAGRASDRGDINRIIEFGNAEMRRLEAEKQRQDAAIIDLQAAKAAWAGQGKRAEIPAQETSQMDDHGKPPANQNDRDKALFTASWDSLDPASPSPIPRDAANQNRRDPQPMAVGLSVPPAFGPETIAASDPAAIDRMVEAMRASEPQPATAPPFDGQRKTFRPTTNPEPGRYDELKPQPEPTPEPAAAPEAVAAAKADNFRTLPPDQSRDTVETWIAAQRPGSNQNDPERIALAAGQEARPTPEAAAAPTAPEEAKGPSDGPPRAAREEVTAEAAAPASVDRAGGFARFTSRLGDFLGSIGDRLGAAITYFSDLIVPPPAPTHEQIETAAKAAEAEQAEEAARAEAYRGYVPGYDPEPPGRRDWRGRERPEPQADFARERGYEDEDDLEPD